MAIYHPVRLSVAAALVASLSACAAAPVPDRDGGVLRLYSGGAFHGYQEIAVYPNDIVQVTTSGPFDKDKRTRTRQVDAGAFQAARDYVLAHPIEPSALADAHGCDDFGGEIVELVQADTSVKYMASCPNARLSALYRGTMAVLQPWLAAKGQPSDG